MENKHWARAIIGNRYYNRLISLASLVLFTNQPAITSWIRDDNTTSIRHSLPGIVDTLLIVLFIVETLLRRVSFHANNGNGQSNNGKKRAFNIESWLTDAINCCLLLTKIASSFSLADSSSPRIMLCVDTLLRTSKLLISGSKSTNGFAREVFVAFRVAMWHIFVPFFAFASIAALVGTALFSDLWGSGCMDNDQDSDSDIGQCPNIPAARRSSVTWSSLKSAWLSILLSLTREGFSALMNQALEVSNDEPGWQISLFIVSIWMVSSVLLYTAFSIFINVYALEIERTATRLTFLYFVAKRKSSDNLNNNDSSETSEHSDDGCVFNQHQPDSGENKPEKAESTPSVWITLFILLDPLFMLINYKGQPRWLERLQGFSGIFALIVSGFELFYIASCFPRNKRAVADKGNCAGFRSFLHGFNALKLAIFVGSCWDIALDLLGLSDFIIGFRCMRMLRLFSLVKFLPYSEYMADYFATWLNACRDSIGGDHFAAFLAAVPLRGSIPTACIILSAFACIGVHLFGGAEEHLIAVNGFETILQAFISAFRAIANDGWMELLKNILSKESSTANHLTEAASAAIICYFLLLSAMKFIVFGAVYISCFYVTSCACELTIARGYQLTCSENSIQLDSDECSESSTRGPLSRALHAFFNLATRLAFLVLVLTLLVVRLPSKATAIMTAIQSSCFLFIMLETTLKVIANFVFYRAKTQSLWWDYFNFIATLCGMISHLLKCYIGMSHPVLNFLRIILIFRITQPRFLCPLFLSKPIQQASRAFLVGIQNSAMIAIMGIVFFLFYACLFTTKLYISDGKATDSLQHVAKNSQQIYGFIGNHLYNKDVHMTKQDVGIGKRFDKVLQSSLSLFILASGENWGELLSLSIQPYYREDPLATADRLANYFQTTMAVIIFSSLFFNLLQLAGGFAAYMELGFESVEVDPCLQLDYNQKECLEFALDARPIARLNYRLLGIDRALYFKIRKMFSGFAVHHFCVLLLVFAFYSVVGMTAFGAENCRHCHGHSKHMFSTFQSTSILLFKCATGSKWDAIFYQSMEAFGNDLIAKSFITFYFFSFIIFSRLLAWCLFLAVTARACQQYVRDGSILGTRHLDQFLQLWAKYDPKASGFVHYSQLYKMLREKDPPLGFGGKCSQLKIYRTLAVMDIPIYPQGLVSLNAVLLALVRFSLSIACVDDDATNRRICDQTLREKLVKLRPEKEDLIDTVLPRNAGIGNSVGKVYCGLLILKLWRKRKNVKK